MITQKELKEQLHYDPLTGIFTWRVSRPGVKAGKVAGCRRDGYWVITLNRRGYGAHRLAWLYVHGTLPDEVDHRDGDPGNNRIDNLRPATRAQNAANRGINKNNRTGFTGVSFIKARGKFQASIGINGKNVNLGMFDTAEDAAEARRKAAAETYGEFAR